MKIAYLDCFSGISGDMLLAALVDAGVPFSILEEAVSAVGLEAHLQLHRVNRSGIDAAKVDVILSTGESAEMHASDHARAAADHDHPHASENMHSHSHEHSHAHQESHKHDHPHGRSLSVIQSMIGQSNLLPGVKEVALEAFRLLGEAEAKIHNVPVEKIHFHEVGAVDAIADIVAAAAGCAWLGVNRWFCSPLNVGGGHVHCAHGIFPVPAPATLELLRDMPVYSDGPQKELVTPTGAALLRALQASSSNFPTMQVRMTGYGAGSRDLEVRPNVLRLVIGETSGRQQSSELGASIARVGVIEAAIDDATPEVLSFVAERLLATGAIDVYRTSLQMKKGRSGTQLTVLCAPEMSGAIQELLFEETTTIGLRYREEEKISLRREFVTVETQWGEIRVKIAIRGDGSVINVAPEFEDCRQIAEGRGVPLKQVMQGAVAAYWFKDSCA
ncbi:nickel pincer cofactor biosynthesis protein LarC [Acidicapsa dinghuensis]|uniref:Putative nickel insertion protein n=1 Tax=Acidicapsa dinghuensis TaxID=2218256 RepID=A0ABW1EDD6_9BACT|nr:nickel pincer cofactor biosynthesis protein LarC [Acidicapsa dinghuensis]